MGHSWTVNRLSEGLETVQEIIVLKRFKHQKQGVDLEWNIPPSLRKMVRETVLLHVFDGLVKPQFWMIFAI